MLRRLLLLSLALPLSAHCQTYADSPFYQRVSAMPSTVHGEAYTDGSMHANGVAIELWAWEPVSSPEIDRISGDGVFEAEDVDGSKPDQRFHFYIEYDRLHAVFGYDLLVQPIEGTDQIRCTFSALTDSPVQSGRNKEISPVALPADLTPVVIHSGDVLAIKTLPLGPGRIAAVHYLRLIRTDETAGSGQ